MKNNGDNMPLQMKNRFQRNWHKSLHHLFVSTMPLTVTWRRVWRLVWPNFKRRSIQNTDQRKKLLQIIFCFGRSLAHQIDQDTTTRDDAYHNRQHIGYVLYTMAHMLLVWRYQMRRTYSMTPAWRDDEAAICLLAALAHDWGHDGRPLTCEPSIECATVTKLQYFANHWTHRQIDQLDMAHLWRQFIELNLPIISEMILQTFPPLSYQLRQTWTDALPSADANQWDDALKHQWFGLLLTESDIGVSLLPVIGKALTLLLLKEQNRWFRLNGLLEQVQSETNQCVEDTYKQFAAQAFAKSVCAAALGLCD
jgi:hypothetical protein